MFYEVDAVNIFDFQDLDLVIQPVFVCDAAGAVLTVPDHAQLVDQDDVFWIVALFYRPP